MSIPSADRSHDTASDASSTPIAPAAIASTPFSTAASRTSRQRPEPSAARIADSRARLSARASARLATFAHTISSRNAVAAETTFSAGRTSPTMSSISGLRYRKWPA